MLVNFEFENFLSYNKSTEFTLSASKGTKHSNHLLGSNRLLSIAAIFGGNASGKSNLIRAIDFSKSIILDDEYDYNNFFNLRFRGCNNDNNIGSFKYTFYVDEILYEYQLQYDYLLKKVYSEKLSEVNKNKVLYFYKEDKIDLDKKQLENKEKQRLIIYIDDFINEKNNGTFLNYLYYKSSENSKFLKKIENIYHFFYKIIIIEPTSQFAAIDELFMDENINSKKILDNYGFNITNLNEIEEPISGLFSSEYEELKNKIMMKIKENNKKAYHLIKDNIPYKYKLDENGNLKSYRISFIHKNNEVFEYEDESDGTKRIFDLLPIIYLLNQEHFIFIVDEIDRSLSAHLCYELLCSYLTEIEKGANSQLIFTTHNLQLLDFNLLRKDEIWLVENEDECVGSELIKFNDVKFRTDMDLNKAYWNGSIGGVSKRLIETIKKRKKYNNFNN